MFGELLKKFQKLGYELFCLFFDKNKFFEYQKVYYKIKRNYYNLIHFIKKHEYRYSDYYFNVIPLSFFKFPYRLMSEPKYLIKHIFIFIFIPHLYYGFFLHLYIYRLIIIIILIILNYLLKLSNNNDKLLLLIKYFKYVTLELVFDKIPSYINRISAIFTKNFWKERFFNFLLAIDYTVFTRFKLWNHKFSELIYYANKRTKILRYNIKRYSVYFNARNRGIIFKNFIRLLGYCKCIPWFNLIHFYLLELKIKFLDFKYSIYWKYFNFRYNTIPYWKYYLSNYSWSYVFNTFLNFILFLITCIMALYHFFFVFLRSNIRYNKRGPSK